jgi:hypothetical protein
MRVSSRGTVLAICLSSSLVVAKEGSGKFEALTGKVLPGRCDSRSCTWFTIENSELEGRPTRGIIAIKSEVVDVEAIIAKQHSTSDIFRAIAALRLLLKDQSSKYHADPRRQSLEGIIAGAGTEECNTKGYRDGNSTLLGCLPSCNRSKCL